MILTALSSSSEGKNMSEMKKNTVAIILAGGTGKRMGSDVPKQYMDVCGKPLLYYTIKAFEDSFVEKIVLVCKKGDEEYCQKEFVEKYDFAKVKSITVGGKERYHSVWSGLEKCKELFDHDCDAPKVVFIQDGARPLTDEGIIRRCYEDAIKYGSGVAAVPSKDTVKIVDPQGFAVSTPTRNSVYLVQTPQTFLFDEIYDAYGKLVSSEEEVLNAGVIITDDAMVMEHFTDKPVKMTEGSYKNIKITTPEDLLLMKEYF